VKKAILIFLCVLLLLSCSGCGPLVAMNTDDTKEKAAYSDAIAALFQALD